MGIGPFKRSCFTNSAQVAPNPNPGAWALEKKVEYENAYVLLVTYIGCTNFEGKKLMVFRGKYRCRPWLDPHFSEDPDSPIARFRPDDEGWKMANAIAASF